MIPKKLNVIVILVFFMTGCNSDKMFFNLKEKKELKDIPSASGIEETKYGTFVIGDNSPWLYRLNENLEIADKFQLLINRALPDSIFEKPVKPDFEAMCKANTEGTKLFVFGSGSKSPERDVLVEVDLSEKIKVTEYVLEEFYRSLKSSANLSDAEMNIEAAEVFEEHLYLFNRGKNLIMRYPLAGFNSYLKNRGTLPAPEIFDFTLPKIDEIEAGFSGAGFSAEMEAIIFTATVENTDNWIDDGEVLGSFVGVIKLSELGKNNTPQAVAIVQDGGRLKIKVESITVLPPFTKDKAELLLVTDSDGGTSEILSGTLTL